MENPERGPLETVRHLYEEAAGLDRKQPEEDARARRAFASACAEDVEFSFVGPAWNETEDSGGGLPGSGQGLPELGRAWQGWIEAFASYRLWPLEYAVGDDRVMVRMRAEATLAGATTPIETEHGVVLTVRDGMIRRVEFFYRSEDARSAIENR